MFMFLIVTEGLYRTWLRRKEQKRALREGTAKHRSNERANWSVYIRRYWSGVVQTHRAWADMGASVWELVSVDVARKYGRQFA